MSAPERASPGGHVPVLMGAVMRTLGVSGPATVVDCTAGLGGHAAELARGLSAGGRVLLMDLDEGNLARAVERVRGVVAAGVMVEAVHGNFAGVPREVEARSWRADVVLADLGFCSNQVDDAARGLSFMRDGPLDMRLNVRAGASAAAYVAGATARELERVIREYGEDRMARRIAEAIVRARAEAPITTTGRLAEVIRAAIGRGGDAIDPATRTFQALRIAVNDELGNLTALLDQVEAAAAGSGTWLAPGARVGIISFHSLEDRPVKRCFTELVRRGVAREVGEQPITADEDEVRSNPRARSAKLRVVAVGREA